jgi:hypothetical protein
MLAEPRRKQRYTLNPRGNYWARGKIYKIYKTLIYESFLMYFDVFFMSNLL